MKYRMNMKLAALLASMSILSINANADVHVWDTVHSEAGYWNGTLASINENASFVDANGSPMTTFTLNPAAPVKYGFSFGPNDDFDVAYTLTLTQQTLPQSDARFTSKTCVFVITAKGPGQPVIQVLTYNGAQCSYKVNGNGDDYYAG